MKICVTIKTCVQVGFETSLDGNVSKLFEIKEPIANIIEWIKSVDETQDISNVIFSKLNE